LSKRNSRRIFDQIRGEPAKAASACLPKGICTYQCESAPHKLQSRRCCKACARHRAFSGAAMQKPRIAKLTHLCRDIVNEIRDKLWLRVALGIVQPLNRRGGHDVSRR
jgi:ribosomal protein L22